MERYIQIKNANIPLLGLGTWDLRGKSCINSVEDALEMGYRHIDTARMYANEDEVGTAVRNSKIDRSEIYIVTKINTNELKPQLISKVTEDSLRRLKTGYIDLLLIHWPVPGMDLKGVLEKMYDHVLDQKILNIGVSNFSPDLVKKALEVAPVICNQVEFHPFHLQHDNLSEVKRNNMFLTAYTPLARGRIFREKTITEIAENHKKSNAQVTLRWLIQHKSVAVIPKAANKEHRLSNLEIFDFELTENEMKQIGSLSGY